jgi:pimeloyl-ACP methyl ester carboxylesterase
VLVAIALVMSGFGQGLSAQQIVEVYEPVEGVLRIGPEPERAIPMTERGHTLILPDGASVQGVVVFIDARRFRSESFALEPGTVETEALHRDVAVLHITTGNPLDFLFAEPEVDDLARRVGRILDENGLGDAPVFLAGLSLGGTRALRLAEFLRANGDPYGMRVTAVAIVDAPLDMVRLWHAERRAAEVGFHPAAADEGRWVTYLLETHLAGTPSEARSRYVQYSPFVFGEEHGGNARYLRDVALRAYHEPDVDWWIANRAKSYYSMNSLDLAALVNELRLSGNSRAELVTTVGQRRGYAEGASPHTWSIVDNGDLIDWFLEQAER